MRKNRQRAKPKADEETIAWLALALMNRTGPIDAEDSFVMRVVKALDIDFERLAQVCEISYVDIYELARTGRTEVSRFDTDPMWNKLQAYVFQRYGHIVALKQDLDVKMQADRKRRIVQRLRQETHR